MPSNIGAMSYALFRLHKSFIIDYTTEADGVVTEDILIFII